MATGIVDYGTKSKQQLLDKHLKTLNLSFQSFLTNHQHLLYHLCFNKRRCCKCTTKDKLPRNRVLNPQQLDILFEKQSTIRSPGHKGSNDFCCCMANNVDITHLDLTLLHCILNNCCLDMFWNSCLDGSKLEKFLNENKHDIFHLVITNTNKCMMCNPTYKPKKSISDQHIRQDQWDILFYPVNDPTYAIVRTGINLINIENDLASALLNMLCPLKIRVEELTSLRNTMYGHAIKGEIENETFQHKWKQLKECLNFIAKECNMADNIKQKLKALKDQPLDQAHCSLLCTKILDNENRNRRSQVILLLYF